MWCAQELLDALQKSDKGKGSKKGGKKSMGALEMYAMGLKATGAYMCRTLSYDGAEFELKEAKLTQQMSEMYDRACNFSQVSD